MTWSKSDIQKLLELSEGERQRVRNLVSTGRWCDAEPDEKRKSGYFAKSAGTKTARGAESIIGTEDFQGAVFLPQGSELRRAIAYVEVISPREARLATGFLISPDLFLTNWHVLNDETDAAAAQITFDREADPQGGFRPMTVFALDPARFALFSPQEELDYALVAVGRRISGAAELSELSYCILSNAPNKHVIGMNCNIIQHPRGLPKMISIRNYPLVYRTDTTLLYETDTDEGTSGSPVFSDAWELVALHHWGQPFLRNTDDQGHTITGNVNEGVRISSIYDHLTTKLATLSGDKRALLQQALAYSTQSPGMPAVDTHLLSPPRPGAGAEALHVQQQENRPMPQDQTGEIRLTIPLEISVRARVPVTGPGVPADDISAIAAKTLTPGAEARKRDTDFSGRSGYDEHFIPAFAVEMPKPDQKLAKQIGELHSGVENAQSGILKYEHFSILMNRSTRVAMFTATNIDGRTYLDVNRSTGQVANAQEGDTWYPDPRISDSYYLDQTFYSAWSTYFDRGHLTRRSDPTWGDPETAERANTDTFHFTNCSPQHFRFNESTEFWQGAERYVLENGVLADQVRRPICVIQGPIFDDKIDKWAGDVQIPSSFFKVIAWNGQAGPKSVGLIVDQLSLLSETRKALGPPRDVPSVNVAHWRMSIDNIERRTGLIFSDAIKNADTFPGGQQVQVGEAAIPIRSMQDILG